VFLNKNRTIKGGTMDFKLHFQTAWTQTLKNIVPVLLMTLAVFVVSAISFGILAPVTMAGYVQSLLMMIRSGREPNVKDIFSEMRLFLPLLGFGAAVAVVLMIGFSLLVLPGIVLVCGLTFLCLYMMPLMTDRNYGVVDAVKESVKIVTGPDLLEHVIAAILFLGISAIGSSVFIGWLFTQPLATLFILSVYEEKIGGTLPKPPPPPPADFNSSGDVRQ
jgi:uncharacterized membrane protein